MRGNKRPPPVPVAEIPRREFQALEKNEVHVRFAQTFSACQKAGWAYGPKHDDDGEYDYVLPLKSDRVHGQKALLRRYGIVLVSSEAVSPVKNIDGEHAKRRRSTGATPIAVPVMKPFRDDLSEMWAAAWPGFQQDGWRRGGDELFTHPNWSRPFTSQELLEEYKIIGYASPNIDWHPAVTSLRNPESTAPPKSFEVLEREYKVELAAQFKEFWDSKRLAKGGWQWKIQSGLGLIESVDVFYAPHVKISEGVEGETMFTGKETLMELFKVPIEAVKPVDPKKPGAAAAAHHPKKPAGQSKKPAGLKVRGPNRSEAQPTSDSTGVRLGKAGAPAHSEGALVAGGDGGGGGSGGGGGTKSVHVVVKPSSSREVAPAAGAATSKPTETTSSTPLPSLLPPPPPQRPSPRRHDPALLSPVLVTAPVELPVAFIPKPPVIAAQAKPSKPAATSLGAAAAAAAAAKSARFGDGVDGADSKGPKPSSSSSSGALLDDPLKSPTKTRSSTTPGHPRKLSVEPGSPHAPKRDRPGSQKSESDVASTFFSSVEHRGHPPSEPRAPPPPPPPPPHPAHVNSTRSVFDASFESKPNRALGETTDQKARHTPSKTQTIKPGEMRQPNWSLESPMHANRSPSASSSPGTPVMTHVGGKPLSPVQHSRVHAVFNDLKHRFPGRHAEVGELACALALEQPAPIMVFGEHATGKTSIVMALVQALELQVAVVSAYRLCGQGSARLFSQLAHQLPCTLPGAQTETLSDGERARNERLRANRAMLATIFGSDMEPPSSFQEGGPGAAPQEKQLPRAEARTLEQLALVTQERLSPDETLVIVVDDVDEMASIDSSTWFGLCSLGQKIDRKINVVFIGQSVPENLDSVLRSLDDAQVRFAPYTTEQSHRILASGELPLDCPSRDIYLVFLDQVFNAFAPLVKDLLEWQYICMVLWPAFYEPVKLGRVDAMLPLEALNNMKPQIAQLRRRMFLHDVAPSLTSQLSSISGSASSSGGGGVTTTGHTMSSLLESLDTMDLDAASDVPLLAKILVAACYLCSYRKKEEDKVLFGNGQVNRAKKKNKSAPKTTAHEISVALPHVFDVERARYVFCALLYSEADVKDPKKAMREFDGLMMTLQSLHIIERRSPEGELDEVKFEFIASLEYARNVAKLAGIQIDQYL